jgi:Tc toxin complex TcA C-terminal TcB-binding domain/Neuraminidase-like domain/Salmonella virulence plasmid 28.1kDa A protein
MPKNPARRSRPAPNRMNKARPISTVMLKKELPPIASKESMRGTELPHQERPIKQASSETNQGPVTAHRLVVRGRVTYADRHGASGLLVKAFAVAFKCQELRGKTKTSSTGDYELEYRVPDGSATNNDFKGLQVIVCDTADRQLAVSEIQYGVASTRTIDILLPASERGPSEYEKYHASLKPFLKGHSLVDLQGGDNDKDLTYLAGVSGVARDRLNLLVAAEKMACGLASAGESAETNQSGKIRKATATPHKKPSSSRHESTPFTSPMFYAWMREGLPSTREELLATQPGILANALKKASNDNLIPAVSVKKLKDITTILIADHTERVLRPSHNGESASLGDVLNLMSGKAALLKDQKHALAMLTLNQTGDGVIGEQLKTARLTAEQVNGLSQVLALNQICGSDSAVLRVAHQHIINKSKAANRRPLHAVADLDESDWRAILKTSEPDMTDDSKIGKRATALIEKTAEHLPNEFLLARALRQSDGAQLKSDLSKVAPLQSRNKDHRFKSRFDELKLDGISAGDRRAVRASFDRVKALVNRNPGLELDTVLSGKGTISNKIEEVQKRIGVLDSFVQANPDTNFLMLDFVPDSDGMKKLKFDGLHDTDKSMVLRAMKARQRVYRIAGGALRAQHLMETGFHSAHQITKVTPEEFVGVTKLPLDEAKWIYAEAWNASTDTGLQFMAIYSILVSNFGGLKWASPPQIVNHLKRFDGFKDLFGAQAICKCQHCRSVLGPTAYFVDLMRFVDDNITKLVFINSQQADQTLKLQYRRPDLWELPLTCENANTLVPTLEIVNEILENFIDGNQTPTAAQRPQIQKAVYLRLAQATNSFAQPYVLPIRQIETYLSHFQLTRAQLAKSLELDADTTARARLGLSLVERDLVVNAGTSQQVDALFGTAISAGTSSDTQLFLALSKWTRDELGQLLKTSFVQDGNPITIESSKASAASVQNDREIVKGYSRPALDRLHRFTRLWRAIQRSQPWSIPELDLVLASLTQLNQAPIISGPLLANIADLLEIQERFGLSVEQLCVLVGDIPRMGVGIQLPFFDRLFNLHNFVVQDGLWPTATALKYQHPSSLGAGAAAQTVEAQNKLTQRLIAGLQVSDKELVRLLDGLGWLAGGMNIDLGNLTLLYRHALLARSLKIAITDLFALVKLGQIANGLVTGFTEVVQLIDIVDRWRETSFSIDDLLVISGGTATDPTAYPDTQQIADAVAEQIRTGHLLEFSVTTFQVLGITAEESKQIIQHQQNSSVFERVPQSENYRLLSAADPTAAGFTLTGVPSTTTLAAIANHLNLYHTRNVLETLLAAQLRLSVGAMHQLSALCGNVLTAQNTALTQELYGNGPATVMRGIVAKFVPLVVLFKEKVLDESHLKFVATKSPVFGMTAPLFVGANPTKLSFDTAIRVAVYARLVGVQDEGFTSEQADPNPVAVQTVLTQGFTQDVTVAKALRVDPSRITKVKAYLSLNNALPFDGLRKLTQALSLNDLLGLGGSSLPLLVPTATNSTTEYTQLTDGANALLAVLRSKYPDEQKFAQQMEPYEDILRSRKRDGLVEYVIRSMNGGFTTTSDLYQFFLIDTQVEGCARTSRIVSAYGSLQLYVQRVLMNLERSGPDGPNEFSVLKILSGLSTEPLDRIRTELEWRRTYRVWEANRKVFLYPESYLEPELRDDKTPLFKELESTLLQQRINEENATDAYSQYLEGYEEVASLRIAGAFHDINESAKTDRLHLFGSTADDPPVYYYRAIDNVRFSYVGKRKSYQPWQKMSVQIPVRDISPVIFDGRLLVMWVQITTTPANKVEKGESRFVGYQHRFTIYYSEKRGNDMWSPPQKLTVFDKDGLPFERLDDPLEEPTDVKLLDEIPSSALQAAITQANASETLFAPVPVIDTNDPNLFKQKLVTLPDDSTRLEYVFRLVRLAPNPNGGYTPRYDTTKQSHLEPIDGYTLRTPEWTRVHAEVQGNQLFLSGMDQAPFDKVQAPFVGLVNLFDRTVRADTNHGLFRHWMWLELRGPAIWRAGVSADDLGKIILSPSTSVLLGIDSPATTAAMLNSGEVKLSDLSSTYTNAIVVNKAFVSGQTQVTLDSIVDFINDHVMFLFLDGLTDPGKDGASDRLLTGTALERLGTTIRRELRRELFTNGINGLLSLDFQKRLGEQLTPVTNVSASVNVPKQLIPPTGSLLAPVDYQGPFGVHFQELFFHIPFLIANNLNSQQRFSAAQRWYHYLFDPTSPDMGPYRVWRCRQLVEEIGKIESFRNALTNGDALEAYRRDPFNPHAIARLRPGTHHKTIVMKYIDNLLDWGDALFAEFTMESLNEATMLYVLAADILGPRPPEIGDCGEASGTPRKYSDIVKTLKEDSDFLIELEHLTASPGRTFTGKYWEQAIVGGVIDVQRAEIVQRMATAGAIRNDNVSLSNEASGFMDFGNVNRYGRSSWRTMGGTDLREVSSYGDAQRSAGAPSGFRGIDDPYGGIHIFVEGDPINPPGGGHPLGGKNPIPDPGGLLPFDYKIPDKGVIKPGTSQSGTRKPFGGKKFPPVDFVKDVAFSQPLFCIPPNKDLMAYWDRIEDRLYKIRNCMDISGAKRRPSLYEPELDPRELVEGKAAGLPLDDVLNGITGDIPPYRFSFLIEKAKQYASTVQSFGGALLSALEKKDAEQLSRLRAVQEQNIVKLRTRIQELEIQAAEDTLAGLERQRESVELRQTFYDAVLQTGLIPWERAQQVSRHTASILHGTEAILGILGGTLSLLPQFGAPTAMKYGGAELGSSAARFAIAMQALATISETISASAGLEATFQRRDEDWRQQKRMTDKELENIKKQIEAAKARVAIARRSLDVHNKTVEHAEEVFQYYQDKFTNQGLYTMLSTQLQRAHRDAYNAAFAAAKMAERAYRYEREYETATGLSNNYWVQDQAGLQAGEKLLLDLQNLERRYLETNYRTLEIEQSFSLMQVDPSALVVLRETGNCTFTIPEALFDLAYPGQYRRRIKGVRLTMPCIVGPHTTVGARLQLKSCDIRDNPTSQLRTPSLRHTTVIAMSTAQNDSGTFEFTFRDERYMPFEGLGAVNSQWDISLPGTFKTFDYRTISDVVLRISYTAEEDTMLRSTVENVQKSSLKGYLKNTGVTRIYSLRHEFPDVWSQLIRKPSNTAVTLEITDRHLPYFLTSFLSGQPAPQVLTPQPMTILLQTNGGLGNLIPQIKLNNNTVQAFPVDNSTKLPGGVTTNNMQLVQKHTLTIVNAGSLSPAGGQPGTIDESFKTFF